MECKIRALRRHKSLLPNWRAAGGALARCSLRSMDLVDKMLVRLRTVDV